MPPQRARKDHDAVSCFNPEVTVHDCKLRVDGISKYLDSVGFRFDHAFGEEEDNQLVRTMIRDRQTYRQTGRQADGRKTRAERF